MIDEIKKNPDFCISLFKATKDFERKKLRIITSSFWNLGVMTIF